MGKGGRRAAAEEWWWVVGSAGSTSIRAVLQISEQFFHFWNENKEAVEKEKGRISFPPKVPSVD